MDEILLPWLLVAVLAIVLLASCTKHTREWTDADFRQLSIELGKQQRDLLHK